MTIGCLLPEPGLAATSCLSAVQFVQFIPPGEEQASTGFASVPLTDVRK